MAGEKEKEKQSAGVPGRGVEVTAVGDFPRPKAWGVMGSKAGDAAEIPLMKAKTWHPTTKDFLAVANVPNTGLKKPLTEVILITNFGELLGAILKLNSQGDPTRPLRSIKRLNIISHGISQAGKFALYGMGGTIDDDGTCRIHASVPESSSNPNAPMGGGLDASVLEWLDGTGLGIREECRARFRDDGEIGLILCNSAGIPWGFASQMLMGEVAKSFNVKTRGYKDEIYYPSEFDEKTMRILRRDYTRIGKGDIDEKAGLGYFCDVKVPDQYAGRHLEFNKNHDKPAPSSP
jgi:hypothetical protein